MDARFSAEDESLRLAFRAFISEVFPEGADYPIDEATADRWLAALVRKGWQAYRLPKAYGGTGWTHTQQYIWEQETAAVGLPPRSNDAGLTMLAPALIAYGDEAQRARFLPPILAGTTKWCQGYSEPGAGSDLAGLSTRAERAADGYVVNGQKVWTSGAHTSDWMFTLVRTAFDGRAPQRGISFLLIDLSDPGVDVQPIHAIDGVRSLNQVFLNNVRVPFDNRVGDENEGWTVAKGLLAHERMGQSGTPGSVSLLADLVRRLGLHEQVTGGLDRDARRRLCEAQIGLSALELSELRTLAQISGGEPVGGQAAILKLIGGEVRQAMTEVQFDLTNHYRAVSPRQDQAPPGRAWESQASRDYYGGRAITIAGGSAEIQRNIIARRVLGI